MQKCKNVFDKSVQTVMRGFTALHHKMLLCGFQPWESLLQRENFV